MSLRKLVSIRKISDVSPIKDADYIEVVTIDGWKCVTKKGHFNKGDLAVYFEIDSFLDTARPAFSFLSKMNRNYEGRTGAVLRTALLRGQLSQGLALPIQDFPEIVELLAKYTDYNKVNEQHNLAELLNVVKWEYFCQGISKSTKNTRSN